MLAEFGTILGVRVSGILIGGGLFGGIVLICVFIADTPYTCIILISTQANLDLYPHHAKTTPSPHSPSTHPQSLFHLSPSQSSQSSISYKHPNYNAFPNVEK